MACCSDCLRRTAGGPRLNDASKSLFIKNKTKTQVDVTNRTEGRSYTDSAGVPVLVHYDDRSVRCACCAAALPLGRAAFALRCCAAPSRLLHRRVRLSRGT